MKHRFGGQLGIKGSLLDSLRACYTQKNISEQMGGIKTAIQAHRNLIREVNSEPNMGTEAVRLLSEMVDTLIRVMWDHLEMNVALGVDLVAIVAVGGYGRLELCPQSDIDLLILTSNKPSGAELEQAESIVRNLWDYGFVLGSSVRTIDQCVSASIQDPETWTSFLNERFIAGNHDLYRKFIKAIDKPHRPKKTEAIVAAKLDERTHSKQRQGDIVQMLEPNLKEGSGGLRDVHMLMWVAKVRHGCDDFQDLVREGLITPQELEDLNAAYDFVLRVRCCLHFLTGKKDDRLTFYLQPEVANEFGFKDGEGRTAVEHFLQMFHHHTKIINRITTEAISRWSKPHTKGPKRLGSHSHFEEENGALDIKAVVGNPFLDNVNLIMEYFRIANELDLGFSHRAFLRIQQAVPILASLNQNFTNQLPNFLALCQKRSRIGRMLRAMNDAGLISLMIPDFNYIYCLAQHDLYHIYTTDEHTLTVIRQLAYLPDNQDKALVPFKRALLQVEDIEVLILACFFHDIGKGLGPNHSVSGSKLILDFMEKAGFDPAACREGYKLVLHHLLMNEITQRRDLDDPKTLRDFLAQIESPATLHKLFVLTYCDVSSVHPDAWSGWKAQLLTKLYHDALAEMLAPFQSTITTNSVKESLIESVSRYIPAEKARFHLEHLPRLYASSTTPEEIIVHVNMIESLKKGQFSVKSVKQPSHWEITVVAPDHKALLCSISGSMAHLGISIMAARIYTRIDGVAIDRFLVSVPEREKDSDGNSISSGFESPEEVETQMLDELQRHIQLSSTELHELQRKRRAKNAWKRNLNRHAALKILFHNDVSDAFSAIDITCPDRIGLLFQVTRVLADLNLDVHGAVLTTEVDKAFDSFYVTDPAGKKITEQAHIDSIINALHHELDEKNDSLTA